MASSVLREPEALAQKVRVTADELVVKLVDGRTVSVPVQWYPRLAHGSPAERQNWQIIERGVGVHWPYERKSRAVFFRHSVEKTRMAEQSQW